MPYEIPDFEGFTTLDKVLYIRSYYPDSLAADIAVSIGISRERVRQILKKLGLESNMQYKLMIEKQKTWLCGRGGCSNLRKSLTTTYCSIQCYVLDKHAPYYIACTSCGTVNRVNKSRYELNISRGYRNYFCNRSCFQEWRVGKPYGILRNIRTLPKRTED